MLAHDLESLTPRESDVAFAICDGGGNEAIADRLYIALPTLRTHLMRINQKLGTRSKGDVVRLIVGRLLEGYRSGRITPAPAEHPRAKPFRHVPTGEDTGNGPSTGKIIDRDDDAGVMAATMPISL